MITNEEISEEFEKYNNFENYSDIAKYFLLNDGNLRYIHELVSCMEFDDIESISSSIKLVIDLLEEYNVNLFDASTGVVYKLVEVTNDAPSGELPEISISVDQDTVGMSEEDIYLFNKQNINDMIYNALKNYVYAEVANDATDNEIKALIFPKTTRGIKSYSRINDLIIGRGPTFYDYPVQLIIHRIFKRDGELFFHGKVHIIKELAEKYILRVR